MRGWLGCLAVVCAKEWRESVRDRRVLLNGLVLGPLLGPVLFTVMLHFTVAHGLAEAERALPVLMQGAERVPNLVAALAEAGIERAPAVADPVAEVRAGRAEVALIVDPAYVRNWQAGDPARVEIVFDSGRRDSEQKADRLRAALGSISRRTAAMRLMARGEDPSLLMPVAVGDHDVASAAARGALLFAMLPYFLFMTTFLGGMWLAIDAIAGERERLSLEPLLATPAPPAAILGGKWLAASAFAAASLLLGLAAFTLSARVLPTSELGLELALGPALMARALLLMLPLVLLITIAQVLVASYARSYREAQTRVGLLQLLPLIPSLALAVMPQTPPAWLHWLPVVGQQLALLQWLKGAVETPAALVASATLTLLLAALLFDLGVRRLGDERVAVAG